MCGISVSKTRTEDCYDSLLMLRLILTKEKEFDWKDRLRVYNKVTLLWYC